jgi:hypothetical protein
MTQLWLRLRRLAPMVQGIAGALLVLVLYLVVSWTLQRWHEFVVMRNVVAQIIQQNQAKTTSNASAPEAPNVPR